MYIFKDIKEDKDGQKLIKANNHLENQINILNFIALFSFF